MIFSARNIAQSFRVLFLMFMNFLTLETAIANYLSTDPNIPAGVDVVQPPETASAKTEHALNSRVTVTFHSVRPVQNDPSHLDMVSQNVEPYFEVKIEARTRSGVNGVFALEEWVTRRLLGYHPDTCITQPLRLARFESIEIFENSQKWSLIFSARGPLVEDQAEPGDGDPNLITLIHEEI